MKLHELEWNPKKSFITSKDKFLSCMENNLNRRQVELISQSASLIANRAILKAMKGNS